MAAEDAHARITTRRLATGNGWLAEEITCTAAVSFSCSFSRIFAICFHVSCVDFPAGNQSSPSSANASAALPVSFARALCVVYA